MIDSYTQMYGIKILTKYSDTNYKQYVINKQNIWNVDKLNILWRFYVWKEILIRTWKINNTCKHSSTQVCKQNGIDIDFISKKVLIHEIIINMGIYCWESIFMIA